MLRHAMLVTPTLTSISFCSSGPPLSNDV
jgi:hypothetical protein